VSTSFSLLIVSSSTSAKTTWYPELARRGPMNPRPMLPAPKWTAFLELSVLMVGDHWCRCGRGMDR
jgi:hypothetical protein